MTNRVSQHLSSGEEVRLRQLHHWLTLEGSSIGLGFSAFFIPYGLIFMLLKWGAIIFTPYMIWQLYQSRRYSWIVGFVIFVGIPTVLMLLRQEHGISDISGYFIYMIPLITFYAYTWILRHSVGEWIDDLRWKRQDRLKELRRY